MKQREYVRKNKVRISHIMDLHASSQMMTRDEQCRSQTESGGREIPMWIMILTGQISPFLSCDAVYFSCYMCAWLLF
jgi:hypothetical protein